MPINCANSQKEQIRDIVIVNGEGTMHHGNGYQLDRTIDLCKGKRAFLINTVFDKPEFRNKLNFELIATRESLSAEQVKKHTDTEVMVVPDLSLYQMPKVFTDVSYKIGYTSGITPENKDILGHLKNHRSMIKDPDYLKWLNALDFYVTGRFHGVCMAAYYGIPFLAFKSNSHKIEGMLKDMGCSDLLIEREEEISHKLRLGRHLIDKAQKYAKEARAKQEQLFEKLSRTIQNTA